MHRLRAKKNVEARKQRIQAQQICIEEHRQRALYRIQQKKLEKNQKEKYPKLNPINHNLNEKIMNMKNRIKNVESKIKHIWAKPK